MLGRICRFELDVKSFCDEQDRLDVILAGVMQDASLHQRPAQLLGRNDFSGQRIELNQLRKRRGRVQIDERAPAKTGLKIVIMCNFREILKKF